MFYTIYADGIKRHLCDTWALTQQVLDNLQSRFPDKKFIVSSLEQDDYLFDLLGMLNHPKVWCFPALNYYVKCYVKHWGIFCNQILTMSSEKYENKFFKLHGLTSVLCLSPASYTHLRNHIELNRAELDKQSEEILGWAP